MLIAQLRQKEHEICQIVGSRASLETELAVYTTMLDKEEERVFQDGDESSDENTPGVFHRILKHIPYFQK